VRPQRPILSPPASLPHNRALSFAAVLAAHRLGDRSSAVAALDSDDGAAAGPAAAALAGAKAVAGRVAGAGAGAGAGASDPGVALSMVPLDKLDLQRMSIIYTTGDMHGPAPPARIPPPAGRRAAVGRVGADGAAAVGAPALCLA
jgi:hypothetical protein